MDCLSFAFFKELVEFIRNSIYKLRKIKNSKYKLNFKEMNKLNHMLIFFWIKTKHYKC